MKRAEVIEAMLATVPSGRMSLSPAQLQRLTELTHRLAELTYDAEVEFHRFVETKTRRIDQSAIRLRAGNRVLITGGTGCIGSSLVHLLQQVTTSRIASVSRGTFPTQKIEGVDYYNVDVCNYEALISIFKTVQPDLVFHLAAQRDPGLAEIAVKETVNTNILGTSNVLRACLELGVETLVYASTGKAVRVHSRDVYVTTKRIGECLLSSSITPRGLAIGAARFTHVVDNSIVFERAYNTRPGGYLRIHDPHIGFYVQSATESAQLLMNVALDARPGEMRIQAIRNLDWPIVLLDALIGYMSSINKVHPIYFSGFDPGYDRVGYPGFQDPNIAGEVSPLINSLEASSLVPASNSGVDMFRHNVSTKLDLAPYLRDIYVASNQTDTLIRSSIQRLSFALLEDTLTLASTEQLERMQVLSSNHRLESKEASDVGALIRKQLKERRAKLRAS